MTWNSDGNNDISREILARLTHYSVKTLPQFIRIYICSWLRLFTESWNVETHHAYELWDFWYVCRAVLQFVHISRWVCFSFHKSVGVWVRLRMLYICLSPYFFFVNSNKPEVSAPLVKLIHEGKYVMKFKIMQTKDNF